MSNLLKRRISQLPEFVSIDSTAIIPISKGAPLSTGKITANNLLSDCAKLSGGNSFSGQQHVGGDLSVNGTLSGGRASIHTIGSFSLTASGNATLPSGTTIGPVTWTEISRLAGVTSPIQTQLNTKANLTGGNTWSGAQAFTTLSGTTGSFTTWLFGQELSTNNLKLSPVSNITIDGNASIPSSVLLSLSGISTGQTIQSQLNSRARLSSSNTFTASNTFNDNVSVFGSFIVDTNENVSISCDGTITINSNGNPLKLGETASGVELPSTTTIGGVSSAEISRLSGVTSNIQLQLNSKLNSATFRFLDQAGPILQTDHKVYLVHPTAHGLPSATEGKELVIMFSQPGISILAMPGELVGEFGTTYTTTKDAESITLVGTGITWVVTSKYNGH